MSFCFHVFVQVEGEEVGRRVVAIPFPTPSLSLNVQSIINSEIITNPPSPLPQTHNLPPKHNLLRLLLRPLHPPLPPLYHNPLHPHPLPRRLPPRRFPKRRNPRSNRCRGADEGLFGGLYGGVDAAGRRIRKRRWWGGGKRRGGG